MTKYQLAKLVLMAGGLRSRKRVQKTVHLLQAAGCDLEVDYRLHYYGPYSSDVADLLDRLTEEGILAETPRPVPQGTQFDYRFNEAFLESLQEYESTPRGMAAREQLSRYERLLRTLQGTEPRTLELASTIVHFVKQGQSWEQAVQETCEFKNERPDSERMDAAQGLANKVYHWSHGDT